MGRSLDISGRWTIVVSMTQTPGEHLAEINHALALAQTNLKRAFTALGKYEEAMGMRKQTKAHSIRCIAVWQEWLAEHGPGTRQGITMATGVKLTERATPHTVVWDDAIDSTDDDAYPENTLFRVRSLHNGGGRGAPPVVYFLWSQRFSVRPKFGVGPIKPEHSLADGPSNSAVAQMSDMDLGERYVPSTILGVIQPEPTEVEALDSDGPDRYTTMDEWDVEWASYFDSLAQAGGKPSDEQRALMQATLPDGEILGAAIAIAYRAAVERQRTDG